MTINEDLALTAQVNLYYDLFRPGTDRSPLLIALHGYGANKRYMMREAQRIVPDNFAIVSLQGPHQHMREPKEAGGPMRFGFGWLTNFRPEESVAVHHQAVRDVITNLIDNDVVQHDKIFLLGFSQSCALNYRFAFTHPEHLRGVIGICGGMPGDWETNEKYETIAADVFHLTGTRDEFYTPERIQDYEKQLGTRANSVTFKRYDAAHEIVPAMRDDIKDWLTQRARQ